MSKHSSNKHKQPGPEKHKLQPATKRGVGAVICLALAIFFLAASFNYAGPAGTWTYGLLNKIIGAGFFTLPLLLILLASSFLTARASEHQEFGTRPTIWPRLAAALFLFLALLGFLELTLPPLSRGALGGGILGRALGGGLNKLFSTYSFIILTAIMLVALLVMFDAPLKLGGLWSGLKQKLNRPRWLGGRAAADYGSAYNPPTPASVPASPPVAPALPLAEAAQPASGTADSPSTADLPDLLAGRRPARPDKNYRPPPLSLLEADSGKAAAGDIKANANIIKRTLQNFGIVVEMDEVVIGPSITRYALRPAEGVKLSKIVSLQNDLALALAAHPLRIEAPIPGKSQVGIEVPNRAKTIVGLSSLLAQAEFTESPWPLLVSLGRDIAGRPHFANLAKAPHMLIAGATGAGKSVVIHTFIISLLYRNSPRRLRLLLVDPKRVELTMYKNIPHLLTPVVTEAKKAILVLKWAIQEMERRYELLEADSARDIQSYHQKNRENGEVEMPYIIIVIDELADIMSSYPRELEAAVVRLAQMSRAVGIHLVVSTQRPSVEVITGLIKANIPARLALQVASQIDSRTILDMAGAEKLLGAGDLLYLSAEMSKPIRLQSAFVSEAEAKKVADHLARQETGGAADSLTLSLPPKEEPEQGWGGGDESDDELYEAARTLVLEAGKASASYLQRKLKIGYARAARLLDILEERGVVGPGQGAKHRDVYADTQPT